MISAILRGGLSNNLFIMATTIAHSLKTGVPYCIPLKVENPHYEGQQPYIFPGVKYCDKELTFENQYNEQHFHYAELPQQDSLLLNGYFQSWKFIEPYRNEILKAFGFDNIETKQNVCSLHFRSTDYKLYPTIHPIITPDYIRKAISYIMLSNYKKFMVFSDAIPEIKEIISSLSLLGDLEFEYAEGNDELTDLKLMASCASNITANSSFSIWAAYINPNPEKIVISPRRWFGKDLSHDTKDLYIPKSIIL